MSEAVREVVETVEAPGEASEELGVGGRSRPCIVMECEQPATGSMEIAFDSKAGFWGTVFVPACAEHRPTLIDSFNSGRLVINMNVTLELLPEAGETYYPPAPGLLAN